MPSENKRLCVFGDSHFACVKLAADAGLVATGAVDLEFWGNIGKQFRHLTWRNGQIEPLDDFTATRFAKTNTYGRRVLTAADFDMVLFMGCRIDIHRLFAEGMQRRADPDLRLSSGVEARWFRDFLHRLPPYHFARNFAAQNTARIVMAPVPFDTDGFDPAPPATDAALRRALWDVAAREMQRDGIDLLAQPDETVVAGCRTDPAYAVRKYRERNDRTHKNPKYGALILKRALEMLDKTAARKRA